MVRKGVLIELPSRVCVCVFVLSRFSNIDVAYFSCTRAHKGKPNETVYL